MNEYSFVISLVVLILGYRLIVMAMRRRSGGTCQAPAEPPGTEAELLRDLHHGLARMEKRIEALETLLADREEAPRATAGENKR